jgi:hypothetical protein
MAFFHNAFGERAALRVGEEISSEKERSFRVMFLQFVENGFSTLGKLIGGKL